MLSFSEYQEMYNMSINDTETFLKHHGMKLLEWDKPFTKAYNSEKNVYFEDGMLNACNNVLDRHYMKTPDKVAFICINNEDEQYEVTYAELMDKVIQISSFFLRLKLQKGDVVSFFGNNSLEFYSSILACARLGLVSHFIFGGYSSHILKERLIDTDTKLLITMDYSRRGEKLIKYFETVKTALKDIKYKNHVLIYNESEIQKTSENIHVWSDVKNLPYEFVPCTSVNANDDLLIIFTSGSTGKSKGIVHSTAGFLFGTKLTIKLNFGYYEKNNDIFFSTADIGWLACFSHSIYGPLLWGGTSIIFIGIPFYPSYFRIYDIVVKNKVTHFYTAPTVIRMLKKYMQESNTSVHDIKNKYDLSSLRIIGSVGELLNEEPYTFLSELTDNNIPIINTYWQTETGSIMISPLPIEDFTMKGVGIPACCVSPRIIKVDSETNEITDCQPNEKGILLFSYKWPSLAKTILNDHQRFEDTYLKPFPGYFYTGDEAVCDEQGNYYILGRCDDVINVCGHRISTLEIESALSLCKGISEFAAVGIFDKISGQKVCLNIVLCENADQENVIQDIKLVLNQKFGSILRNYSIKFLDTLPKTNTGKLIRRLLKEDKTENSNLRTVNPQFTT